MYRLLIAPLTRGLTYRRYVHMLLGAVLSLPYIGLGALFVATAGSGAMDPLSLGVLLVAATGVAVGVALVPGVHALEVTAARALLGAGLPEPDPDAVDTWPVRRRAALWLLINIVVGVVVALLSFLVVPTTVGFVLAPWVSLSPFPQGLPAAWLPPLGLLMPVLLLRAVDLAGGVMARVAVRVLGPTPAERLATELAAAQATERTLAERNRLARELHDSVGHALTVTTLQAGAAARVLDSDPAFVAKALDEIAEAGRTALAELDHVLGLLREEGTGRAPQRDLADVQALLKGHAEKGRVEISGPITQVPAAVSREAYRIVQESVTNALRHAGEVPVDVRIVAGPEAVEIDVTNPLRTQPQARSGGGRGLAGMRERVTVLRGTMAAGPAEGCWRVRVRLPTAGTP